MNPPSRFARLPGLLVLGFLAAGTLGPLLSCRTLVQQTDRQVVEIVAERQAEALGIVEPPAVGPAPLPMHSPTPEAYNAIPYALEREVPEPFQTLSDVRATTGMLRDKPVIDEPPPPGERDPAPAIEAPREQSVPGEPIDARAPGEPRDAADPRDAPPATPDASPPTRDRPTPRPDSADPPPQPGAIVPPPPTTQPDIPPTTQPGMPPPPPDETIERTDYDVLPGASVQDPAPLEDDQPASVDAIDEDLAVREGADEVDPDITDPTLESGLDEDAEFIDLPSGERWQIRFRAAKFTLTDALAYAQQHQREYQSAKEDLYLVALALTLERHLWTPQFAAELRQVYGNFGEIRDFDNATRFVADLGVTQRLPYGGEFTARAIGVLIRDLGRSITAEETGQIELGLNVPLLRGAGMVAREDLIQLERDLTYAVRTFERFRRRQLVEVADRYFLLLQRKQAVRDAITSLRNATRDLERAKAQETAGFASPLDTGRAESRVLSEANRLANLRESFRASADQFKILIGMPVAAPIGIGDLETIGSVRAAILNGQYPLLRRVEAVEDAEFATDVALRWRLDVLNTRDRISDAKRGVSISKNALLPTLNWNSTVTWDTDPNRFEMGGFEWERTTWRTEIVLQMTDRFAERNQYRRAIINVNRARRDYIDSAERLQADVLSAINQVRLQEQVLEIQERNLEVSNRQREFARIRFEDGDIDNRDLVEAEDDYVSALNQLNQARTDRWSALLNFRLATGTIRIDEYGVQTEHPMFDFPGLDPVSDADEIGAADGERVDVAG